MAGLNEAKQLLGELFLVGFKGLELPDDTAAFFSQARIGGAILFSHNYDSPAQVAELTNEIQNCRNDLPLWIGVDQEGGKVQRFKRPFTRIPEAMVIGHSDSPKTVFDAAEIIAKELKAVGINLNFCPVADIATNPKNPVIGNRAYGTTEERVTKIITAMVRGHLVNGIQPCVKHFPGHGDTSVDSHFALPKVDTDLEVLRDREFRPFVRAFKSRCNMVMIAHILNPTIDSEYPATLSEKTIQGILRKELRYSRIVFSDDMEMKAITDHFGAEEAPVKSILAGCDILIYRTEEAGRKAYEACMNALEKGHLPASRVLEAADRSRMLKKEFLEPYHPISVADIGQKVGLAESYDFMLKLEAAASKVLP